MITTGSWWRQAAGWWRWLLGIEADAGGKRLVAAGALFCLEGLGRHRAGPLRVALAGLAQAGRPCRVTTPEPVHQRERLGLFFGRPGRGEGRGHLFERQAAACE